jgi:hypothetical protein
MKRITITLLTIALAGCTHKQTGREVMVDVKQKQERADAEILKVNGQRDKNPAIGYDWWHERTDVDFQIVEMEQGRVAASHLRVCSYHGVNGPLSNRLRDECDRIAARGKQLQAQRDAAEKRKDDAYDKAHKK